MGFPTLIIQNPSAMIFLFLLMTTIMVVMKLDGIAPFPFEGDSLLILVPIHYIFLKMAMCMVSANNRDAVRSQRDTFDLLDDDTDDNEMLTDDEATTVNRVNNALFGNAMLLWPTFIAINMKLLVDPHNENYSWGWGLWPFVFFCFYFFVKGLENHTMWWSDGRRLVVGDDV